MDVQSDTTLISVSAGGKIFKSGRGDIVALQNINLDVASGEFVSILGPSGCGKSTLLKCIGGLQPHESPHFA